jgi:hypothetical protein
MTKATENISTFSRRQMAGLLSAAVVGIAPAQANPDADLIRLCGYILDTECLMAEVHGRRKTIEDERRTDPELTVLFDKRSQIEDALYDIPAPTTLEGARAMARLALAGWPTVCEEGEPYALDFDEWVSLSVFEFLDGLKLGPWRGATF